MSLSLPPESIVSAGVLALRGDLLRILGKLPDGAMLLGEDWLVNYANIEACRVLQVDCEAVCGKCYWEMFPSKVGTPLERDLRSAMERRLEARHTFFYDPSQLWVELRVVPIETGIALLYRDVTAQRLDEETKAALTRRLEQVLEATTDGISYVDRDFNFTYFNRRGLEMVAPSGDILGKNLWECYPDTIFEGSPYEKAYNGAMYEGVAGSFVSYYPEPLNMWLSIQALPAPDGIVICFRDVTAERLDKEALRLKQEEAERQRLEIETIYCMAPVGLALYDPVDFRYLRMNDRLAEFFGMHPDELIGRPVTETAPIPGLLEMFQQVARGESVQDRLVVGELTTDPGRQRYWSASFSPVYGPDGTVVAITGASVEVTKQKRAEALLIQSEKLAAVGRLSQTISHEINNPLQTITNLLYLVTLDGDLSAETRENVEAAQGEIERVSQIADQALNLSRQSVTKTAAHASLLLSDVLHLYRGRLANCRVALESRLTGQTVMLCHENQIRQVLNNLISNALDAMPRGGRLLVRSRNAMHPVTGRPGVRLTIADTGEGMSVIAQSHIFEPFYTTKEARGTGLGMWISADIVSQHDGQLSFRSSTRPGRSGTVFSLFLPSERRAVAPLAVA